MRNLLLIFFVVSSANGMTSFSDSTSRITGGSIASPGQFPFVAQIQLNGNHWCSGFIYNYDWIVTTASCVNGYQNRPESITVVLGQVSLLTADPDEEIIPASSVIIHEKYDPVTRYDDIAMIQLSEMITLGKYVSMIPIESLDLLIQEATVIGWADGITGVVDNLRSTTVPIRENAACLATYNNLWDADIMICAGNATNDACNGGDGGGPLVLEKSVGDFRVVGLVSHVLRCGDPLYPTAYTRLSSYSNWIESKGGVQVIPTTTEAPTTTLPTIRQCTVATGAGQFPFMASILNSATLDPLCAGFIYNEQYVVTTASCVIRKTVSMVNVTIGQFRFDRPELSEKTFPVSSVVLHPLYRESNQSNNIAVVKISGNITFGKDVNFYYYDDADYVNPSSTVSGWASKTDQDCTKSLSLLWDESEIVQSNTECSQLVTNFDGPTTLCTRTFPINCEFESGASLIQGDPPVVVGIKSLFNGCNASSTVIYTRIAHYWNWLIGEAGYQPQQQTN